MSLEHNPLDSAPVTEDQVLERLRTILADVIGEEYVAEVEIGLETSFYQDLELESIDFVMVAGRLQDVYGERIDLPAWIATKEVDEIIAMTVGQLVGYLLLTLS